MSTLEQLLDNITTWAQEPGITYEEIANKCKIAGVVTSESAIRRFLKKHSIERASAKLIPLVEDTKSSEEVLQDEVDWLTAQLLDAKQIIKRQREKESLEDRVERTIETALGQKASEFLKPVLARPKKGSVEEAREMILLISDAHYGEVVNPDEALGIKYDPEIARRRIEFVRDKTIQICDLRPVSKITIACLGDMVSGVIHEELEVTNQSSMVDQTTEMAHILFNLGKDISSTVDELEMIVIPGNHPRIHKKPRYKQKFDNWEFIMGKMIQGMAKYGMPDVTIKVPKDMVYIHDVFGFRVAMVHGDGVKSNSFAGIPFYGLKQRREALQALLTMVGQSRIDALLMGHFHQRLEWGGDCDVIINPSIKGGDEFGIGSRLSAPDPEQLLLEWHREHGLIGTSRIKLKHIT